MYLKNLTIRNFRNYSKASIEFSKGLNFFIGQNTQGKSNLIEAICLLSMFKSLRTSHYENMIKWGSDFFYIKGGLASGEKNQVVEVVGEKAKGKRIRFNNKVQPLPDHIYSRFLVVFFIPENFSIIKGPPANRRNFLDFRATQTSQRYFHLLKQYKKVLFQKNLVLQQQRKTKNKKADLLDSWDKQLVEYGTEIIIKRKKTVKSLSRLINKIYNKIASSEEVEIVYNTFLSEDVLIDRKAIKENWKKLILIHRDDEIKRGISLYGPHRDNLTFTINKRDAKVFASQGQIKTILLALHLAEIRFIYEELGEYPIVLLDEAFSELDEKRIKNILAILPGEIQIFISEIDGQKLKSKSGRWFKVQDGTVERMEKN